MNGRDKIMSFEQDGFGRGKQDFVLSLLPFPTPTHPDLPSLFLPPTCLPSLLSPLRNEFSYLVRIWTVKSGSVANRHPTAQFPQNTIACVDESERIQTGESLDLEANSFGFHS